MPKPERDAVDRITSQWNAVRPDVDVSPIDVIGRVSRLSRLVDRRLAERSRLHDEVDGGIAAPVSRSQGARTREDRRREGREKNRTSHPPALLNELRWRYTDDDVPGGASRQARNPRLASVTDADPAG